jgi:hypothetical protein
MFHAAGEILEHMHLVTTRYSTITYMHQPMHIIYVYTYIHINKYIVMVFVDFLFSHINLSNLKSKNVSTVIVANEK